jgi:WD40 repeat protein
MPLNSPERRPNVPDHELVRCIGKGSYGEVWLARNVFGVFRAVKLVYRSSFDSDRPFQREFTGIKSFEPVSRSHPSFMAILHVGQNQAEGYFYYVMELADDQQSGQQVVPETYEAKTISSEVAARSRLPLNDCIQVGVAIGDALATLHAAGLVHRDIKPANIIYVNGRPKLADIGLVHTIASAATFVGTQGYIPPEGPGTVQADIYALGKLLYEISTGNDRQQFPQLPDFVAGSEDGPGFAELNEVLVRACESNPKDRYADAAQLCSDLQLIGRGESLRRLRTLERRWRVVTRTGVVAAVVIAIVGGLGWVFVAQHQRAARARASQAATALALGARSLDEGDNLGALPWFVEAQQVEGGGPGALAHEVRIGSVLEYSPHLVHCWWHDQQVRYAEFSPDGRQIAFADTQGAIQLLDWHAGVITKRLVHDTNSAVVSLDFSADGRLLLSGSRGHGWRVWDLSSGEVISGASLSYELRSAAFSPKADRVVTAGDHGGLHVWNATNGALIMTLKGHSAHVRAAEFSHDGEFIVSTSHDFTTVLWNSRTGEIVRRIKEEGWGYAAAFNADDEWIVSGGSRSVAQIWRVEDAVPVFGPLLHPRQVCAARFSPDRRLLATVTYGGVVYLWDLTRQGAESGVLRHPQDVHHAGFSSDGRFLVTSSFDHSVRVWEVAPASSLPPAIKNVVSENGQVMFEVIKNRVRALDVLSSNVLAEITTSYAAAGVACSSSGAKFLVRPASAGTAMLEGMDFRSGQRLKISGKALDSRTKCHLAEGAPIAVTLNNEIATAWDLESGERLSTFTAPAHLDGARLTRNGATVVLWPTVESGNTAAWLVDTKSGREVYSPLIHDLPVGACRFDASEKVFATACRDRSIAHGYAQLWNAATGQPIGGRLMHTDGVLTVDFSADGKLVATGGEDNVAYVWNVDTGARVGPLRHQEQVWAVEFTHGMSWLTTGAADGTARVWDVRTGAPLTPMLRQPGVVTGAHLAGDGMALVTTATRQGVSSARVFRLELMRDSAASIGLVTPFLSGETLHKESDRQAISQWAERNRERTAAMSSLKWHTEQGLRAHSSRNYHGGVFHLERALKFGAEGVEVYSSLAMSLAELGDFQAAMKWFKKAVEIEAQPALLNRLAAVQLLRDDRSGLENTANLLARQRLSFGTDRDSCWTVALAPHLFEDDTIRQARSALQALPLRSDTAPLLALLSSAAETNTCADFDECLQVIGNAASAECYAAHAVMLARCGIRSRALVQLAEAEKAAFSVTTWQRRARYAALRQVALGLLHEPGDLTSGE